ncbi:DUF1285 domain-containing protein [Halomonas sp. QX-2]|jgi:hypothetical protein|uniref:DUF1285 domain-containing protein n=1 Tax=Vreelandella sedimenti TaxID=2729618 RepID=A0A7Z0N5W7_9GAMM|nr:MULTISPECIES: DUF1285 domain-containing protein [Halomonas]NYT71764.1 DUF1285 domain-containing protein [Halomonas sedimenti]|tara:strand:+ start:15618 stop:16190 length:573 start_codon:yes stop_codon:yes gene_type:complete
MNIDRLLQQGNGDEERVGAIPPLDEWQPALSGDMNIIIHADGSWSHEGQPFARPKVARLLATLLRLDDEGYCLVTPVERWRVKVEDLPLVAVEADFRDGAWWFTTQFDDVVRLDAEYPLTVTSTPQGEAVPQLPVRFGLAARLHRNVYYQLVEAAETRDVAGGKCELGLTSAGQWFALGQVDDELLGEAP